MKNYFIGAFITLLTHQVVAQGIQGTVYERIADPSELGVLTGVNVYWAGTSMATTTDSTGRFGIPRRAKSNLLVFSFVGYRSDTIEIGSQAELQVILDSELALSEVTVRADASLDRQSSQQTQIINGKELAKAACCNLSESFENNASISVSYSDAVTGAKQIQMLGLNGVYIQTNINNIPSLRGLESTFGMNYIPGTWIHSIDIGKGTGSIVNGYESMTGQMNVELKNPDTHEKLLFNTYVNSFGRGEINLNLSHQLNKKWSTGLLTHSSMLRNRVDKNHDGFLDLPLFSQFNGINRWKYQGDKMTAQFGIKALHEDRLGGQTDFHKSDKGSDEVYGFGAKINRYEFFSKIGRIFPNQPYKGLGLILNASLHDSKSYFGTTSYDGRQNSLYGNLIFQSIIGSTNHSYKAGVSYLLDDYQQQYGTIALNRRESVPGAFVEYTFHYLDKFMMVAGGRVDQHNLFGTQWTPRLHLKYDLNAQTILRASAGKGFRVANPFAEYYGNLVSARHVEVLEQIRPEVTWNYGASLTHEWYIGAVKGNIILDYYRTNFDNQLVADMEDPEYLRFYNLKGSSFANSFQAEINITPIQRLDFKMAYRLFDVQQTLIDQQGNQQLTPRMMISRNRLLFNAGYALPYDKWKFDATLQWNGKKRIPQLEVAHHQDAHGSTWAPSFANINAQITRTFPNWDIYAGGENLGNFRQKSPIIGADKPFDQGFDAGMAWGPITGRMLYLGVRYKMIR
ncbi:outer membrane receptor protein involved in Fe transport [Dyadobacter jejuensis]|uniref:Outer membrane receptor protein involved in Fe transport n=1 Tax=Dyadobacter jejuensis TaxID=1082580 RepID=A0A316AQB9_9BACT|nr:TonB-dependent receptor [Dyadobacter jejuensis]PWJ59459.1 outer membrane receptor protein involved in Fe transport [Dyadobacter jejuensis]